jgi:hypothetical protein
MLLLLKTFAATSVSQRTRYFVRFAETRDILSHCG